MSSGNIGRRNMSDEEILMRELSQLPRNTKRAGVHLIDYSEFIDFEEVLMKQLASLSRDDLQIIDYDDLTVNFDRFEYDDAILSSDDAILSSDTLLDYLQSKPGIDLRRGDFVCIAHRLGYRNEGKAIYDGIRIVPLADQPDDYGSIPEDFQAIIEFPPMYWTEVIDHNNNIPFNFNAYLPNVTTDDIYQLDLDDGKSIITLLFRDVKGEYYYIFDERTIDTVDIDEHTTRFINNIHEVRWFQFFREEDAFPLTLEQLEKKSIDPEYVMALDSRLIDDVGTYY